MDTKFSTFIGTDRNQLVLPRTDSRKSKQYRVLVSKRIVVTLREWKSGRFSMPDMNTALDAQEPKDVSSRWYHQQSMADRKHSKVWLHFSKCEADYARCNICDRKCKTSIRNTSSLVKHQIKRHNFHQPQIYGYNSCIQHR
ncbi:hypothetical protein ILYODFUR_036501 [Ilyodon furcidens]|uniref:BED-type domain-containing protein n=1 Tax=Ilyodon furcidens TaxID=33524 RepID=A0ABV0UBC7_9TELE